MPHLFTTWAEQEEKKGNSSFAEYLKRIVRVIEHPTKPLRWAFDQSQMESHPEVREMMRILSQDKWSPRSTGAYVFPLFSTSYGWYRLFQIVPEWWDHEVRAPINTLALPNECRPEMVERPRPPRFQDFLDCNRQTWDMTPDEEEAEDDAIEAAKEKARDEEVLEARDARNEKLERIRTSHFSGEKPVDIPVHGIRDEPKAEGPEPKKPAKKRGRPKKSEAKPE